MHFTVGEMRKALAGCRDDDILTFGAQMFDKVECRGPNLFDVQLRPSVSYSSEDKKFHLLVDAGCEPEESAT